MRQVAGAFAEYEKARLVGKLRAARDRKAALTGLPATGRTHDAAAWQRSRSFALANPDASYTALSARLAERGFLTLPPKKAGAAHMAASRCQSSRSPAWWRSWRSKRRRSDDMSRALALLLLIIEGFGLYVVWLIVWHL